MPPDLKQSDDWLTSKTEIKIYCGNASDYMFKKYIKAGMPARPEDGRWSASKKAIDEWWYLYNRVNASKFIDQISDDGGS